MIDSDKFYIFMDQHSKELFHSEMYRFLGNASCIQRRDLTRVQANENGRRGSFSRGKIRE